MDFSSFSWLAVLAAVVANMVLGFLWYGPLFGKSWRAAVGKTEEDRPDPSLGLYLVPVLSSLVGAIVALERDAGHRPQRHHGRLLDVGGLRRTHQLHQLPL